MKLWTIQTKQAWKLLQKQGFLIATDEHIMEKSWLLPYRWMIEQMKKRLGPPPYSDCCPVWGWFQWESSKRRCPDLRAGGHLPKNERGVRIEFECSDSEVLLSDFELWHYVLNYWYLPESEADGDAFEAELKKHGLSFFETKPLPNPKYHERILHSWDRIFDLNWTEPDISSHRDRKSIQVTIWQLSIDQVRNYKHFKAR